jgi:hypothetical protein
MADAGAHVRLLEAEIHLAERRLAETQMAAAAVQRLTHEGEAHRAQRLFMAAYSLRGRPLQALAEHLLGRCALAQGDTSGAEAHLRAALDIHMVLGAALEAARTRLLLAQALGAREAQGPIPHEAKAHLAAAQAQFVASGAALDLAQAEQLAAAWETR